MILRDRPSGWTIFLITRGSVLPRIGRILAFNVALATAVTITHGAFFQFSLTISTIPFSLIGLPLAIFLGFRNSAAYGRYWEARKLWGELLLQTRNLTRQCLQLMEPPAAGQPDLRARMLRRAVAYCHALRVQLRGRSDFAEAQALVEPGEWQQVRRSSDPAAALMLRMGADLAPARRDGLVDAPLTLQIDTALCAMTAAAAGCERIRHTPIPFSYTLLLHRTAYLYCFLLPFGLVDTLTVMTPVVVAIVAYTFFGLDALGDEIEEPFGEQPNDLPLDAICRTIEIGVREALGETNLPPPLQPVDHWLR